MLVLPRPEVGETHTDWVSRCMASAQMKSQFPDDKERAAVAAGLWASHEPMWDDVQLREVIQSRSKDTSFGYGILTADRYVKTLQEAVDLHTCQITLSSKKLSFHDALDRASKTLVYSNEDMLVVEKNLLRVHAELEGVELPKNMLMAFKHVLTTPRKDRDNDILRTEGGIVDPRMPLLWQHCACCPIGKMLKVFSHDETALVLISAIVDINELSHDAAVMIDNGMGRFSHGFRPLEFTFLRDEQTNEVTGFDITRFEIMEASLVSVPSNVDAEVVDVLVTLAERGKLTSGFMKQYCEVLRTKMPAMVKAGLDLSKETKGETGATKETDTANTKQQSTKDGSSSPSEKEDAVRDGETKDTKAAQVDDEKSGRRLSRATLTMLRDVCDDMQEVMSDGGLSRGSKALLERCHTRLSDAIKQETARDEEDDDGKSSEIADGQLSAKQAATAFLAQADAAEMKYLLEVLAVLLEARENDKLARDLKFVLAANL